MKPNIKYQTSYFTYPYYVLNDYYFIFLETQNTGHYQQILSYGVTLTKSCFVRYLPGVTLL